MRDDRPADRRIGGDRPAAQVIAIGKAARHADDIDALGQCGVLVPDHRDPCDRVPERHRKVTVAIGAGKDDDGDMHGLDPLLVLRRCSSALWRGCPSWRATGGAKGLERTLDAAAPAHVRGQAIRRFFSALYPTQIAKAPIDAPTSTNRLSGGRTCDGAARRVSRRGCNLQHPLKATNRSSRPHLQAPRNAA
jgi:hypothetical protein